jgi:2-keto-4-pentenoate hydratase/2-oxohepta-3-ene-1,7-dioic acid hydratase in catechol pathway
LRADGARALDRVAGIPLADRRLLAPLLPPTIRDFTSFERHVEGMAMFEGASGVPDGFYDAPRFYFSSPHAVAGPDEDVPIPPGCERFDYELEVAAVIGAGARDLDVDGAREVIFGYTLFNDWSARDIGRREIMGKLGPAKAKDTTNTLGPMLVTADELERHRNAEGFLDLELCVERNGTTLGRDTLANASWTMEELVVMASRGTWVRPGDVIGSGTCGSGCLAERWAREGADAPPPLAAGDVVVLRATGLGTLRNRIVTGVEPIAVPRGRRRITG